MLISGWDMVSVLPSYSTFIVPGTRHCFSDSLFIIPMKILIRDVFPGAVRITEVFSGLPLILLL